MSALQRKLAHAAVNRAKEKEQVKELWRLHDTRPYPWSGESWQKAGEAVLNGTWQSPQTRFPFLLDPDGPISSASKLQKLARMESLPEVMEMSQIDDDGQEIRKATICAIDYDDWDRMEENAEVCLGIEEGITVIFEGRRKFAAIVKRLKDGVILEDKEEQRNSSGDKAGEAVTASSKGFDP